MNIKNNLQTCLEVYFENQYITTAITTTSKNCDFLIMQHWITD